MPTVQKKQIPKKRQKKKQKNKKNSDLANWSRLPSRPARQVLEQAAQQLQQAAQKAAQARAAGQNPGAAGAYRQQVESYRRALELARARAAGLRPGRATAAGGGAGGGPAVQFVSGKSFYQNAGRWIDSEIQTLQTLKTKTKKIRIKFGSPDYFKLVTDKPAVLKWISLGKHVEFVLDGKHYEIYEDKKNAKN